MIVRIDRSIYSSKEQPIALVFTDIDQLTYLRDHLQHEIDRRNSEKLASDYASIIPVMPSHESFKHDTRLLFDKALHPLKIDK